MLNNVFTLPEIAFIGGSTEKLSFNLIKPNKQPYVDVDGVKFSVISYSNRDYSNPVFVLENENDGVIVDIDDEQTYSRVIITIGRDLTKTLSGKYIYQLEIMDATGKSEIPGQGIITITRNINPST